MLQSSSSFWGNVNEAELLDPDRRRRLTSSVTAGPNGAANVSVIPATTLGRAGSGGLEGLPTRTELRDSRAVTVYEVNLLRKGFKWSVSRRYNDFVALRDALLQKFRRMTELKTLKFPGKGIGKPSTDPEVIFERSTGLFLWLTTLMRESQICRTAELLSFIGMKTRVKDECQTESVGSNYWKPPAGGVSSQKQAKKDNVVAGSGAIASVDRLGRSIAQVINEQMSQSGGQPDVLSEQLVECRTFQNSLLALSFDINWFGARGSRGARLRLVSDMMEIEASNAAAGNNAGGQDSPFSTVRLIPYEEIVSASRLTSSSDQLLIKCYPSQSSSKSSTPRNRPTSAPIECRIECIAEMDARRLIEEVDDRVQLAHHIAKKERQLAEVSSTDADGSPPRYVVSESRRREFATRLDEMTGMNESHRVVAAVDRILNGER